MYVQYVPVYMEIRSQAKLRVRTCTCTCTHFTVANKTHTWKSLSKIIIADNNDSMKWKSVLKTTVRVLKIWHSYFENKQAEKENSLPRNSNKCHRKCWIFRARTVFIFYCIHTCTCTSAFVEIECHLGVSTNTEVIINDMKRHIFFSFHLLILLQRYLKCTCRPTWSVTMELPHVKLLH